MLKSKKKRVCEKEKREEREDEKTEKKNKRKKTRENFQVFFSQEGSDVIKNMDKSGMRL